MLTWTFDTTLGQLRSYLDGALVDTFNVTATTNFNMIMSSSPVGTFGLKGDSGNFVNGTYVLDEVWVVPRVIRAAGIQDLYQFNVLPEPGVLALAITGGGIGLMLAGWRRRA